MDGHGDGGDGGDGSDGERVSCFVIAAEKTLEWECRG